ncbi:response regulator transcription factor [Virgibacillus flavescens]|uniref:response regulator transcription factor n=1 Tax=Virgibacillus flavescens TaxID=1611422 RepID=UPI003D34AF60
MIKLVCESNSDYLEAISMLINTQKDMRVNDVTSTADILLIDLDEYSLNEAANRIRKAQKELNDPKVVAFTSQRVDRTYIGIIGAGADSILSKENKRNVIPSLRNTAKGESIIPTHLALKVADGVAQLRTDASQEFAVKLKENGIHLTRREADIAYLMRSGLKNIEIAERLNLKPGTVKVYVSFIYRKVGNKNRSQVIERFNTVST